MASRIWLLTAVAAALVAAALHYRNSRSSSTTASSADRFLDAPDSNATIAHHLFHLTRHPHVAGSIANLHTTASYVLSAFQQYGLNAHFTDYRVLLSYPLSRSLSLSLPDGTSLYTAQLQEVADPAQEDQDTIPTFHAYSPSGNIVSEAVYVNYGRQQDYDVLRDLGVNLTGAIVVARYGKVFRGDIVALAAKAGAAAALIYSDPFDYAESGKKGFYPDSPFLPPSGVQRGTVFRELGDPLTPGWASTSHAERLHASTELPSIPSLPISALDALPILRSLEGPVAPASWHGALDIPDYRVGRGPAWLHFSYLENRTMVTIRNVLAVIRGSSEPDRFVLLGNHRDAWTYGAVDPNSGTAAMLEVARRLGRLKQEGWKPKRSIYFCNWDAEEYGLIGSTEWVEENEKLLSSKAIAYINVDTAVSGSNFSAAATPQLDDLLRRITRKIKDPDGQGGTVFDSWVTKSSSPMIERLGGTGSDYAPFLQHAGVSAIDFTFGGGYPVYHSTYDNYKWMLKFGDPLFHRHVAIVEIWGLIALELTEDEILPFDYGAYATELQAYAENVQDQLETSELSQNVTVEPLFFAIADLHNAAASILHEIKLLHESPPSTGVADQQHRLINDRLVLAERAFLDAKGLTRNDWYRHLVFGPTTNDDYASCSFPAIQDALLVARQNTHDLCVWAKVQHEIWRVARAATHAALALRGELT